MLPRTLINSIYSVNDQQVDNTQSVINNDKLEMGYRKLSNYRNTGAMNFSYEKPVKVKDLKNSKELYSQIIRNKQNVDYLQKLLEMKGLYTTGSSSNKN